MLDTLHWYLIMVTIVFCAKPGGSVGVYKPGTLPYRKNTTPAPITNEDPRNVTLLQPGVMTTLPSVSQNTSMQTPVMDRANVTMAQEPCSQQQQATTPAAPQMGNNELLGNASSALVVICLTNHQTIMQISVKNIIFLVLFLFFRIHSQIYFHS